RPVQGAQDSRIRRRDTAHRGNQGQPLGDDRGPGRLSGGCPSVTDDCPLVLGACPLVGNSRERTRVRLPARSNSSLAGRRRTRCGHQNQRPSSTAIDGVRNERTTSVSNNRPMPMVVPTCPRIRKSLNTNDDIVAANTRPADVTTPPVPAIARMIPVFRPAPISSLNRETSSRL